MSDFLILLKCILKVYTKFQRYAFLHYQILVAYFKLKRMDYCGGRGEMHHHHPWSWYFIILRREVDNETFFFLIATCKKAVKAFLSVFNMLVSTGRVILLSVILQLNDLLRICFQDFLLLPLWFRILEEIVLLISISITKLSFLVFTP